MSTCQCSQFDTDHLDSSRTDFLTGSKQATNDLSLLPLPATEYVADSSSSKSRKRGKEAKSCSVLQQQQSS
jgi:hypothetical protein